MDGYGTVQEIAQRIEDLGLEGCFLTDHGTTAGFAPFAKAMADKGLFAGFGMEAYQAKTSRKERPESFTFVENGKKKKKNPRDASHLILLAKNQTGYHNLLKLSDEANRSGFFYHPRLDWELLEKHHEGIIATSACMAGLVSKGIQNNDLSDLDRYLNIFKDDFYIELHTYQTEKQKELNEALVSIAKERGIPLVYANDAHYPCEDDYALHETLLCMQYNTSLEDSKGDRSNTEDGFCYHPQCLYIMGEQEVRDSLSYLSDSAIEEALSNSVDIAKQCEAAIPAKKMHLPQYSSKETVDYTNNKMMLIDLVEQGIEEKYGADAPDEVWQRAEYELNEICKAGLADYFLITWDFINWATHKGILIGPGRGSAGGSIISYAIGITAIDPIKYNLSFERFWNPGRTDGLPDIDVDIEQSRRGEVKEYLATKYGQDRVVSIGNHIRMRPKSALDKVGKALYGDQCPYKDLVAIKKIIDTTTDAGQQAGWPEIWELVGEELEPYRKKYPDLFEVAETMTGRISTYGVHASAVVISDVDLPEELPVRLATDNDDSSKAKKKILVTQLEMHGVEDAGFPKFDLLGLRNLDTLRLTAELAGEKTFNYRDLDFDNLPDEFWEQIDRGLTLGLFQIEEGQAARKIGKDLKPRNILDLAAIVALNRPGPLRSGVVEDFIKCRKGASLAKYTHPILEPILEDTYGNFLYQESVIDYFKEIGYNPSDADHIRKMLGKKLVEEMNAEHPTYLAKAEGFMNKLVAEQIWESIITFSKYSFNKSHAVGYGIILAWTMYAKWRWPTEFIMASIMTNPSKAGSYVNEGRKLGIDIQIPDINVSEKYISKHDNKIYYGLVNVKGVGELASEWVIENRPYSSLEDFQAKLDQAAEVWKNTPKNKRHPRSPKQTIPKHMIKALHNAGAFDNIDDRDISDMERISMEEELLGVVISDPSVDVVKQYYDYFQTLNTFDDLDDDELETVVLPGVVKEVRKLKTKPHKMAKLNQKDMAIVKIEWEGRECSFAAFPEKWSDYQYMLKPYTVGEFELKKNAKGNSLIRGEKFVQEQ